MGPLYEMANVDIVVEEELAEMKETLRVFEKQGRFSDRERTVIMDKFSLFLQALVSFQENEVELIDHIGMKMQIMEVFGGFSKDDTDTTDLLLAGNQVLHVYEVPLIPKYLIFQFSLSNRTNDNRWG